MKLTRCFRKSGPMLGVALAFAVFGVLGPSGQTAAAGDPATQLKTALTHAGFAAKYEAMKEVSLHLHHAINCVVGPQDKLFDAAAGNPCQGQGNGFLPDLKASKGENAQYYEARLAAQIGAQAVASNDLAEAKAGAHVVGLVLDDVAKAK